MRKVGLLIFASALVIGLIVSNLFSFGKVSGKFFNFNFNHGRAERGSGHMATEVRDVTGFTALDISGVFEVDVTAGKEFRVEVEADDNLLRFVKTHVRGGTLHIEMDKGGVKSSNPFRVRITAPNIDNLEISGAANVTVNEIKNETVVIDMNGAAKLKLSGETAKLAVEASGACNINAEALTAVKANVEASGASHVAVHVTSELGANASGASKIVYSGSPTNVDKKSSGGSHISQK